MLSIQLLKENIRKYIKNGVEDVAGKRKCYLLNSIIYNSNIKDIDYAAFEMEDVTDVLVDIENIVTFEDGEDDENLGMMENHIAMIDMVYRLYSAESFKEEEVDFI